MTNLNQIAIGEEEKYHLMSRKYARILAPFSDTVFRSLSLEAGSDFRDKAVDLAHATSGSTDRKVTFDIVLKELKRRHFGVLSTVTKDGRSHSAEVFYSVSPSARPLEIYVMTRTKLKKARNIMNNPNVSFVVPLRRRLLTFAPPPCIEFQGQAEIVDWKDKTGVTAFKTSFMGRTILDMYNDMYRQGDTSICFLRIAPDPTIFTYGVGVSILEMRRHMEIGFAKVEIPQEYRKPGKRSSDEV